MNVNSTFLYISDVCTLPKKAGNCMAYFTRYYYDYNDQDCKEFVYGGCDPNANNFETRDACLNRCGSLRPSGMFSHFSYMY